MRRAPMSAFTAILTVCAFISLMMASAFINFSPSYIPEYLCETRGSGCCAQIETCWIFGMLYDYGWGRRSAFALLSLLG